MSPLSPLKNSNFESFFTDPCFVLPGIDRHVIARGDLFVNRHRFRLSGPSLAVTCGAFNYPYGKELSRPSETLRLAEVSQWQLISLAPYNEIKRHFHRRSLGQHRTNCRVSSWKREPMMRIDQKAKSGRWGSARGRRVSRGETLYD